MVLQIVFEAKGTQSLDSSTKEKAVLSLVLSEYNPYKKALMRTKLRYSRAEQNGGNCTCQEYFAPNELPFTFLPQGLQCCHFGRTWEEI